MSFSHWSDHIIRNNLSTKSIDHIIDGVILIIICTVFVPLGLLYLGRSLEDEGHTVEIIQLLNESSPEETLRKSLHSADAVGISISSKFFAFCLTNELEFKKVLNETSFKRAGIYKEHLFYKNKFNDLELFSLNIKES